jgi:uncharacterized protein YdgA (DUF945 family)
MKKAVFALVVLVCIGLIGPKLVGGIVEEKYQDITNRLNENPSIVITEHNFTRDWFSGQAVSTMKFKDVELYDVDIIVTEQLNFGPFIFADNEFTFALAKSVAVIDVEVTNIDETDKKEIAALIQQLNEKLSITSVINYRFNYTTHIVLDAIEFEQDGSQVNIGVLESEFTLSDEKYLEGYINWAGLDFKGPDMNVQVSPLTTTFTQEVISGDYYAGNAIAAGDLSMQLSNIIAKDNNGNELLNIEHLTFFVETAIEQGLMNLHLKYAADSIKGAGQELEKLNFDLALNKLDPQVLIELNELGVKMQQDPAKIEQFSQQLTMAATKLLAKDPEININDLSVVTADGVIKSELKLVIDHTLYDQANPMSIIAAINADAKGVAPLPFFQKLGLAGMIDMYVEQGFIIKEADKLSFAAQFMQGQLTINGKVIPM